MRWFIITFAPLLLWTIPALRTLQKMEGQPAPRWRIPSINKADGPTKLAIVAILVGGIVGTGGYITLHGWGTIYDIVGDFYANIAMECLSIAVTILVIDRLYRLRTEQEEKERLILQMGSPDNGFAVEAVRQLRQRKWLIDGSLRDAYLRGANLKEADLKIACLKGVDLKDANLNGAKLMVADLTRANLGEANLVGACLMGADLSGAYLKEANLENANLIWAKYNSDTRWPDGFDPKAAEAIEV